MFVLRLLYVYWWSRRSWQLCSWSVWWCFHLHQKLILTFLFANQKLVRAQLFVLKATKRLVQKTWRSGKQSTRFISSELNSGFLTYSFLSAKTDQLICVKLVFWKEPNKSISYFFSKVCFANMVILSTPLLGWLKILAPCKMSKSCPLDKNFSIQSTIEECL